MGGSRREIGSRALMGGWLRLQNAPSWHDFQHEDYSAYRPFLDRALLSLDGIQRDVLRATLEGRSPSEIAVERSLTVTAVERLLVDARRSLRTRLQELSSQGDKPMSAESSRRACSQRGCANVVKGRMPNRKELRPYCIVHRKLLSAIPALQPDEAGAEKLIRARGPQIIDIGPRLALALVLLSAPNRRISEQRILMWERDMLADVWLVNNQGIGIDTNGDVFDGQHRLWAIARSGVTVPMLVVSGLDPRARETVDSGRIRSVGDQLDILDGGRSGTRRASWMRVIELLEIGGHAVVTTSRTQAQLQRFNEGVQWMLKNGPTRHPFNKAAVIGALIYAYSSSRDAVERTTAAYATGANLRSDSPILLLRRGLIERIWKRDSPRSLALRTLEALRAEILGERLMRLMPEESAYEYFRALQSESAPLTITTQASVMP